MSYKFIQSLFAQAKPNSADNLSKPDPQIGPNSSEPKQPIVPNTIPARSKGPSKEPFQIQKDEIDKINISTTDLYRKIDPSSCKSMALGGLNSIIKDPEMIRKKIFKRRFMFGKNLDHQLKKEKPSKTASLKKTGKKQDLHEFKNLKYDYNQLKGINDAWNKYILEMILGENKKEEAMQKILKADFHGAHLTILDSKCASLVAKAGIVIKETKNTFILCPKNNKPLMVLKRNSVFEIKIKEKRYKIYGPALENRIEERFKAKLHFNHMFKMNKDLIRLI